jgi:ATP-dependent RNA helicase RhlE
VLFFVDSRKKADVAQAYLEEQTKLEFGVIHSNKSQNLRFNTVLDFKEGNIPFLIATDLISRGLDIHEVTHVINIDVPDEPENYIHRIGRTGRADKEGHALTLISPFEEKQWAAILDFAKLQFSELTLEDDFEVNDKLLAEEQPDNPQKIIQLKHAISSVGAAFHEKKAKNQKVNVRKNWKKIKQEKYGKPKTRGQKKK